MYALPANEATDVRDEGRTLTVARANHEYALPANVATDVRDEGRS